MSTSELPYRIAKALRGECAYCRDPALDGSAFCAPHGERERSQGAARQANRRRRLRAEKRCLDCGDPVRSRGLVRCADCRKANAKNRRSVTGDRGSVTVDEQIPARGHFKLVHGSAEGEARGWEKTARYVGRDRRGAPSREDRRRDALRSRDDGLALATRFERARTTYEGDDVQAMPRIQRDAALEEVRDLLRRAARMFEDAAELYG